MTSAISAAVTTRGARLDRPQSYWTLAARRFLRHRVAVAGLAVLAAIAAMAVLAGVLAPHNPTAIDATAFRAAPSAVHPLGTDSVGRDVLSRLVYASRVSLSVGLLAVTMYVVIGTAVGAAAAYHGGTVDLVLSRLMDIVLSFPPLIIILFAVSVFGRPSLWNVILVLGLLGWPPVARLVRGQVLALRQQEFVHAARAMGAGDVRLILRHLLPNAMAPVLVAATFGTANAILIEAALSFLGLGVQPPTPSWGNMLTDAQSLTVLEQMPWLWVPPGFMILLSVLVINFVGDGLRDALDPSLKL
ncbi:MAG: ABC transporter permease [Armatimonadota bacterium]|nr:ABC transporter permease [Armatimonadota bacterium]MDR7421991.1 ABC transporter permease [Armatimonadota bacterium]MDR7453553.1 ABC transporter permease [Armatimonadota bacterium]MDR7455691.1 ABC transporter permease [Armatimonadota bacterium]MDR7497480.1 ABC transporter permease [Armatimonadota bacterium]